MGCSNWEKTDGVECCTTRTLRTKAMMLKVISRARTAQICHTTDIGATEALLG